MSILDAVDAIHGKRNNYGTTLFGDGARFDRGGGRHVDPPTAAGTARDGACLSRQRRSGGVHAGRVRRDTRRRRLVPLNSYASGF